jgi:hypothetical protein
MIECVAPKISISISQPEIICNAAVKNLARH